MAFVRRNTAVQGIQIDVFHGLRTAALRHLQPSIEVRRKARPRRAKALVDAARTPLLGALADMVRGKEPARLGARQHRFVGRGAAMGEADPAGIFYSLAEVP